MSNTRYDLSGESSPFKPAQLLYISSSKFGGDWHSTPHTHTCLEIFYCVLGLGQFYIGGEYLNVSRDDMVIVNPGVDHTEVSLSNEPLEYIVLGIDGVEFMFSDENAHYRTYNFREKQDEILAPLKTMLREIEAKPDWYETACKNLIELVLVRLLRSTAAKVSISNHRQNKECIEAKRYIDANYAENITLDFLSELTHLNKYYLVHAFNREYGCSPINYLIQRRLRESKFFLSNTNHSLSQISGLLGFSSPSYFSQSFRRMEGVSPAEFRKNNRTNV